MFTAAGTGNLGRDVDVRQVSGTTVANFTIGCKSGFGDKATTVWLDCALWGKQAESKLIDYLKKGQKVSVVGEGGIREYQKKDGSMGFTVTCRVNQIALCGDAGSQQQSAPQQQAPQQQAYQQPAQPQGGAQYTSGNAAAFGEAPDDQPPF